MDKKILAFMISALVIPTVLAQAAEMNMQMHDQGMNINASMNMNLANVSNQSGNWNGSNVKAIGKKIMNISFNLRHRAVNKSERVCAVEVSNLARATSLARPMEAMKIGKKLDNARADVMLVGMNATIDKAEEYGANVSQLVELRDSFVNALNDLKNSETRQEYKQNAKLVMQIVKEFRQTAHQIPELENHASEVKEYVKNEMDNAREKVRAIKEENWEKAKEIGLAVFDLHVCLAEEKINRFYNIGFNTSLAEEKLDEVKNLRDALVSAYDSKNMTEAAKVKVEIARKWGEFHRSFLKVEKKVIEYRYIQAKERVQQAINRLEDKGVNTTKLRQRLNELDERITKLNSTDTSIGEFNKRYEELNKDIANKVREKLNEKFDEEVMA